MSLIASRRISEEERNEKVINTLSRFLLNRTKIPRLIWFEVNSISVYYYKHGATFTYIGRGTPHEQTLRKSAHLSNWGVTKSAPASTSEGKRKRRRNTTGKEH